MLPDLVRGDRDARRRLRSPPYGHNSPSFCCSSAWHANLTVPCAALLFFVVDSSTREIQVTFPGERIDFDLADVPKGVADAIEEAVVCHSTHCFIAASIMIRKTLEEICHDRGATGKDLFKRIEALANTVVLPQGYLEGLHNLCLLGNDGAHIESRHYSQVDREEVEVGIEVLKDVVRAVYQQASTMERLRALKRSADIAE